MMTIVCKERRQSAKRYMVLPFFSIRELAEELKLDYVQATVLPADIYLDHWLKQSCLHESILRCRRLLYRKCLQAESYNTEPWIHPRELDMLNALYPMEMGKGFFNEELFSGFTLMCMQERTPFGQSDLFSRVMIMRTIKLVKIIRDWV